MGIASYIDHTLLKADATSSEIDRLVSEALMYSFHSVCVNSSWVSYVKMRIPEGNALKITSVVGFPLGAMSTEAKAFEAEKAITDGADEIDMVVNIGKVKEHDWKWVEDELLSMRSATEGHVLKLIFETCLLEKEEIVRLSSLAEKAGIDFIKTSTGFSKGGATVEDVRLMRSSVSPRMGVKASGGIRSYADALMMIEAGATRLGTSSGVKIVEEEKEK